MEDRGLPVGRRSKNTFGAEEPPAEDSEARIPCQTCGRKFALDRVGKHQAICQKIANKRPRKEFQVQRTYVEGGSGGTIVGVSAAPKGKGKGRGRVDASAGLANMPSPPPPRTDWRQQSEAFRAAMRAARAYPMPQWGGGSRQEGRLSAGGSGTRSVGRLQNSGRLSPKASPSRPRPKTASRLETPTKLSPKAAPDRPRQPVRHEVSVGRPPPQTKDIARQQDCGGYRGGQPQRRSAASSPPASGTAAMPRHRPAVQVGTQSAARKDRTAGIAAGRSAVVARGMNQRGPAAPLPEWGNPNTPSKYGRDCMVTPPVRANPPSPMPEWGNPNAPSRYGRDCMVTPPARRPWP